MVHIFEIKKLKKLTFGKKVFSEFYYIESLKQHRYGLCIISRKNK